MNHQSQLVALFFSALTSATIFPGTSDAAFLWLVYHAPSLQNQALCVATIGNSLGSFVMYSMGRMLPKKMQHRISDSSITRLKRFGTPLLLLSWVPIVGDALPLAAGWLRLPFWRSLLFIVIGKAARYWALVYVLNTTNFQAA